MFIVSSAIIMQVSLVVGLALGVWLLPESLESKLLKLFEALRISVKSKDGKKVILPKIKKVENYKWGTRVSIHLPYGLSSEDVRKHLKAISESLRKEIEVSFTNESGVLLDVYNTPLPKEIMYELKERTDWRVPVGVNRKGETVYYDFAGNFPHLLNAGISGGGKSVFLRSVLTSLSLGYPVPLMYLCDLKGGIELGLFKELKHVQSFATTLSEVNDIMEDAINLMERRYEVMVKNKIQTWSDQRAIVVIDELAELKPWGKDDKQKKLKAEIKEKLTILSAKGRAAGIDLVLSTQRPSADVVDGIIKTNIASAVSFPTRDGVQSRIILDNESAASLPHISGRAIFQQTQDEVIQTFFLSYEKAKELLQSAERGMTHEIKHTEASALDGDSIILR